MPDGNRSFSTMQGEGRFIDRERDTVGIRTKRAGRGPRRIKAERGMTTAALASSHRFRRVVGLERSDSCE